MVVLALSACHPARSVDLGHVLDHVAPDRMWWVRPVAIWAPLTPPITEYRP